MAPKTVLVPIDFSSCSEQALDYACSLAEKLGATISLVHVIGAGTPELSVTLTEGMRATMGENAMVELGKLAAERASIAKVEAVDVRFGDAREEIVRAAADAKVDLIVIGSHGRRGIRRLVLGSVAEEVVRGAGCPVLVVHPAASKS